MTMLSRDDKNMNTKAFTLIELLLATILGMLVMLGSVGLLENMQRESANFQRRVSEDMNWVEANRHLAQMVRSSSYLNIPDNSTLELYNYNEHLRGTYANTQTGITYTDAATRTVTTFHGVSGAFTPPSPASPGKGWKNGKLVEANVECTLNYTDPSTAPFISALSLSCRTSVQSFTWAHVFNPTSGPTNVREFGSVLPVSDGGYLCAARGSFGAQYANVAKLDSRGDTIWANRYYHGSNPASDVYITLEVPDQYIVAGRTGTIDASNGQYTRENIYLMGLSKDTGNVLWQKAYKLDAVHTMNQPSRILYTGSNLIIVGISWEAPAFNTHPQNAFIFLFKTDMQGNVVTENSVVKYFGIRPEPSDVNFYPANRSIEPTPDGGYFITAMLAQPLPGGSWSDYPEFFRKGYLIRLDGNLNIRWTCYFDYTVNGTHRDFQGLNINRVTNNPWAADNYYVLTPTCSVRTDGTQQLHGMGHVGFFDNTTGTSTTMAITISSVSRFYSQIDDGGVYNEPCGDYKLCVANDDYVTHDRVNSRFKIDDTTGNIIDGKIFQLPRLVSGGTTTTRDASDEFNGYITDGNTVAYTTSAGYTYGDHAFIIVCDDKNGHCPEINNPGSLELSGPGSIIHTTNVAATITPTLVYSGTNDDPLIGYVGYNPPGTPPHGWININWTADMIDDTPPTQDW